LTLSKSACSSPPILLEVNTDIAFPYSFNIVLRATAALVVPSLLAAVYLFLRWVYARAGITAKSSTNQHYQAVPQYPKQGPGGAPAFLHCESVDTANGSDQYLIESQLELADYPAHHASSVSSTGGGARDARSKGVHAM